MPAPISTIWPGANEGWWPLLWFFGKVFVFLFVFIWLRGTLPRLRYDQFMRFGWKWLIPVSIGWILIVATFKGLRNEGFNLQPYLYGFVVAAVVVLVIVTLLGGRGDDKAPATAEFDAFAGGYPVPPLPGQELTVTPRAKATVPGAVAGSVEVGADTPTEGEESPHE